MKRINAFAIVLVTCLVGSKFVTAQDADMKVAGIEPLVVKLIEEQNDKTIDQLFDTIGQKTKSIFWVDWGEEDVSIVLLCKGALETEALDARLDGELLVISYNVEVHTFPIDMTEKAQHTTLLRLNNVLNGNYEIRMIWASEGSDTVALAVLSYEDWAKLDTRFGTEAISMTFLHLSEHTNIFTDPLVRPQGNGN